jgi:uncharacterized protein YcfL
MKDLVAIGVTLFCCGMLTACRTPVAGLVVESHPRTTITVKSRIVGELLTVTDVTAEPRNGLLFAQVQARNEARYDLQMEYRYRWLDAKGIEVDTRTAVWTPVNISVRDIARMQGIAPAKDVADFILDIRFRRPSTRWE